MKRRASTILPIPVDHELKSLVEAAARKSHLSQADVMRSALRMGVPEVVRRHTVRSTPRRSLADYLDAFAGIVRPNKEMVAPSRFK